LKYKVWRFWEVEAKDIDDALKQAKQGQHQQAIIQVID